MVKSLLYIFIFIFCSIFSNGQEDIDMKDIKIENSTLIKKRKNKNTCKYNQCVILRSKVIIQVRSSYFNNKNKFELRNSKYKIEQIEDFEQLLLDSCMQIINDYWFELSIESNKNGYSRDVPYVTKGFLVRDDNEIIPIIFEGGNGVNSYCVFYINNSLYKITNISNEFESGNLNYFLKNIKFKSSNEYMINYNYVKNIDDALNIINSYKNR
jgi:hypothetical protein